MSPKLTINPRYRIAITGDTVMMLDEATFSILSGELVIRVLEIIHNRPLSKEKVLAALKAENSDDVIDVIEGLLQDGFLIEKPESKIAGLEVWSRFGLDTSQFKRLLETTPVAVRALSKTMSERQIMSAFRKAGLLVENEGQVEIVVVDHPMLPVLKEINARNRRDRRPWMLVSLKSSRPWIGPIFLQNTACYQCLYERLRENYMGDRYVEEYGSTYENSLLYGFETAPSLGDFTLRVAAMEAVRWIVEGQNERLEGKILQFDAATWQSEYHTLTRSPSCPVCNNRKEPNLEVRNLLNENEATPGYRIYSSEKLWGKFRHLVSPVTGLVRDMRRLYPDSNRRYPGDEIQRIKI